MSDEHPSLSWKGFKCSTTLEGIPAGNPHLLKGHGDALSQMRSAALKGDLFCFGVIMDEKANDCSSKVFPSTLLEMGIRKTWGFCLFLCPVSHSFTLE